ncbi:UDP-N-acetylglucosamine--N-acetylglucosamine transferase, partial [Streptomyces sp. NPDC051016]
QNAGGLTSLEAFAAGLPVASYRCIPGHGQTNAAALDEAGLAAWIRDPADLGPALAELLHGPRGENQRTAGLALHASAPGPVAAITAATGPLSLPTRAAVSTGPLPTRSARPAPKRFRGGRRLVLTAAATAATVSLGVAAPLAYAYSEAPARFTTVAHYLDGDGR